VFTSAIKFQGRRLSSALPLLTISLSGITYCVLNRGGLNNHVYTWGLIFIIVVTVETLYLKEIISTSNLSDWDMVFYNNIVSLFLCPILAWLTGEDYSLLTTSLTENGVVFALTLAAVAGTLLSAANFATRRALSATSFSVVGVLCKLATILVNSTVWDLHGSTQSSVSLTVGVFGGILYNQSLTEANSRPRQFIVQGFSLAAIFLLCMLCIMDRDVSTKQFHSNVMGVHEQSAVLVVLYGQIRGDSVVHKSMIHNLLEPWKADLALLAPITSDALVKEAKYIWNVSESDDWSDVLDEIPSASSEWQNACQQLQSSTADRGPLFLSGIGDCLTPKAKQGLNLAFRYLAQKYILEHNLKEKYDWFVFTRSDFLYLCKVPPLNSLSENCVSIPHGHDYGGFNDRFHVMRSDIVLEALNVSVDLVQNWHLYSKRPCPNRLCNVEGVLKRHFAKIGLNVCRLNHPGVLVHQVLGSSQTLRYLIRANRSTKDSAYLKKKGYIAKYPREIEWAKKGCGGDFQLKAFQF